MSDDDKPPKEVMIDIKLTCPVKPSLFNISTMGVDPDLPPDVLVMSQIKNPGGLVDKIADMAEKMIDEKLMRESTDEERKKGRSALRRFVWRSLIDGGYVNAVVGIDWGAKDVEAEDEEAEDETTEGD